MRSTEEEKQTRSGFPYHALPFLLILFLSLNLLSAYSVIFFIKRKMAYLLMEAGV